MQALALHISAVKVEVASTTRGRRPYNDTRNFYTLKYQY
jgi:hypothetical protein